VVTPVGDKRRKIDRLKVYTTVVSGLGLVLLVWALAQTISSELAWYEMLLFAGLVAVAELTTIEIFEPGVLFSTASAVIFAALLLFGPFPGTLVAIVGGLVITWVGDRRQARPGRAPLWQRALFNMAASGLATVIAGGIYLILGGRTGEIALLSNLLPMTVGAAVVEAVNSALVIGAISFQTGKPALPLWTENMSWAIPMNIMGMVIGGGGLAVGYQIAGLLGVCVFSMPIVFTIYAYTLYVRKTKSQMARLEEIVAERVAERDEVATTDIRNGGLDSQAQG
jgi:hypothetical protein